MNIKTLDDLVNYIKKTKKTCSYKLILLYSIIFLKNNQSKTSKESVINTFIEFYKIRREMNLKVDSKNCNPISKGNYNQIKQRLYKNPVRILKEKGILKEINLLNDNCIDLIKNNEEYILRVIEGEIHKYYLERIDEETADDIEAVLKEWIRKISLTQILSYKIRPCFLTFLFDKYLGISRETSIKSWSTENLKEIYNKFELPVKINEDKTSFFDFFTNNYARDKTIFYMHQPSNYGCYYGIENRLKCKKNDCSQLLNRAVGHKCRRDKGNIWVQNNKKENIRLAKYYLGVIQKNVLENKKIELKYIVGYLYGNANSKSQFIKDFNITSEEMQVFFEDQKKPINKKLPGDSQILKYKNPLKDASVIFNEVVLYILPKIINGVKIYEISQLIERKIENLGGNIGFPPTISKNNTISNYYPLEEDKTILGAGDNIKIDFGVSIDGFIVEGAFSKLMTPNDDYNEFIIYSNSLLLQGLNLIKAGLSIKESSEQISNILNQQNSNFVNKIEFRKIKRWDINKNPLFPYSLTLLDNNFNDKNVYVVNCFIFKNTPQLKKTPINRIFQFSDEFTGDFQIDDEDISNWILKKKWTLPFSIVEIKSKFQKSDLKLQKITQSSNFIKYPIILDENNISHIQFSYTFIVKKNEIELLTITRNEENIIKTEFLNANFQFVIDILEKPFMQISNREKYLKYSEIGKKNPFSYINLDNEIHDLQAPRTYNLIWNMKEKYLPVKLIDGNYLKLDYENLIFSYILDNEEKKFGFEFPINNNEFYPIIESIILNSYKKDADIKKLTRDLLENGQVDPIIISHDGKIIDGNKRLIAYKISQNTSNKLDLVSIMIVRLPDNLTDVEISEIRHSCHFKRSSDFELSNKYKNSIEIYNLIRKLRLNGESNKEIAERLRITIKIVEESIGIMNLIDQFISESEKEIDYGFIKKKSLEKIFLRLFRRLNWISNIEIDAKKIIILRTTVRKASFKWIENYLEPEMILNGFIPKEENITQLSFILLKPLILDHINLILNRQNMSKERVHKLFIQLIDNSDDYISEIDEAESIYEKLSSMDGYFNRTDINPQEKQDLLEILSDCKELIEILESNLRK